MSGRLAFGDDHRSISGGLGNSTRLLGVVDLLNQCCRYFLREILCARVVLGDGALQMLNAQLHGRERILYLMRNLLCHFAPRTFALRFCQQGSASLQFSDHLVVFGNECSDFVIALPFDGLVLPRQFHDRNKYLNNFCSGVVQFLQLQPLFLQHILVLPCAGSY